MTGFSLRIEKRAKWALWAALLLFFTLAAHLLPCPPLGFDWIHFFKDAHNMPEWYPPWTALAVRWLTWPLLCGLTLSTYAVAVLERARSPLSAAAAMLAMPLFWTLYLGQLDGLALLGVLGLPWLAPLAIMKPQVAIFGILAKRKAMLVAAVTLVVSFAVWGFWPLGMLGYHARADTWPQDVALGLLGLPLAVLTLWALPRDDVDHTMLAGAFVTPRLIPYNLLPLMPAIARLPWPWAWAAALASWLPLAAHWVGPWGWWLAWVSVGIVWNVMVYQQRKVTKCT